MLTVAALLSISLFLAYLLFPVTFRAVAQPLLTVWWRSNNLPQLVYRKETRYVNDLINNCSILKERYSPPLWGYIGHIQTILFSLFGRLKDHRPSGGKRVEIPVTDGSVVSYDLYTPTSEGGGERGGASSRNLLLFVVPGINNTADSDYIRSFISFSLQRNYHIAVLNHIGSLKEPLKGHRIFTYSGCGDTYLMYKDLLCRYGNDVKFVGVGFSLGAFNLVRFLAEDKCFQQRFLAVFSICQGYCPAQASTFLYNWSEIRRVYSFIISKRLVQLLRRHKNQLFDGSHGDHHHDDIKAESIPVSSIDSSRDMNGFPLDKSICIPPDNRIWTSSSIIGFDEFYSRRIMGFNSALELYNWCSCKTFLHLIPSLPILFVNAIDDPLIPEQLHDTVIDYITKHNPNSILIQTHHGGHLGFYEGGIITPNELSWSDRLVFECIPVINKLSGCY